MTLLLHVPNFYIFLCIKIRPHGSARICFIQRFPFFPTTELNSKLSYTTWSSGKKIPFGNVNGNNSLFVELVKLGKVVSCQIVCTIQTTAANTSFTLSEITIPTGYRPARNVYVSYAGNAGANMSGTGRWEICTDGSLKMIGSTAVFSERHASIAWITI